MDKYIYGGDTETRRGEPMTLQFYSEDVACDDIIWVNRKSARREFFKWCGRRKRNVDHVVYVHNLGFDLPEFLYGVHSALVEAQDFDFTVDKWRVTGVYGAPTFARISNGHDITVTLIDSWGWFKESLAEAAIRVCPDLPKLKRPQGIGEKLFTPRDKGFVEYAKRDAVIDYHLGRAIEAMHQEFDIRQCVSVADMAAKIFRHKYLSYTIPQPSREIVEASLKSYHGGKNNVTAKAGWYPGVTSIDLKSAYPWALSEMPAFSNAKLYKRYRGVRPKSVPEYGVYRIAGHVEDCDWPCLFTHAFKPIHGKVSGVWVQGFEVNEAIACGEFKPTSIRGFYYDHDRDNQAPAFRHFMQDFFARKEAAKTKTERELFKLIPNSISGKLVQTRKSSAADYTDVESGTTTGAAELTAGGMFHPFIASACTARPRARMHRAEHRYKALHTATDSIFTTHPVSSRGDADTRLSASGRLGTFALEADRKTLMLVRGKCYVLYSDKQENPKWQESKTFKGKYIVKAAKHGFQGSIYQLEQLIATGKRRYTISTPNTLKQSVKRGLQVNDFVKREMTLKVGPLEVRK